MSSTQFTDLLNMSNTEIYTAITETETILFKLRLKKATRQNFKSHEVKKMKRLLAQLKTLLTSKVEK
jgi:ribosomal protein L29